MKAKLNISEEIVSKTDLEQFNSFIPDNISQLSVTGVEVVEKYGDSVEIYLHVNAGNRVGKTFLSLLTSAKDIVSFLKERQFKDLSTEMKNNLIKQILKNNKSYLKQSIFNNA